MKKVFLLIFITFLITNKNYCQTVVLEPDFGISTEGSLKIRKISLNDTCTIIDFELVKRPGTSFSIPTGSYIKDVTKSEKLFLKSAQGVNLNKWDRVPESGNYKYQLTFPPLEKSVSVIDFGEANEGGSWFIYDIQLTKASKNIAPLEFQGNWFSKNTGDLEYVFLDSVVIINSTVWKYEKTIKQKGITEVDLSNGPQSKRLYLRSAADGNYLIGESEKSLKLYTHLQARVKPAKLLQEPEFKFTNVDSKPAFYKGYIKGFTSRFNNSNGKIFILSPFSGNQETVEITISQNGLFEAQIPILYPQIVMVNFPFYQGKIYLEPGKESFQLIDGSNKNKSPFMGELSWKNESLYVLDSFTPENLKLSDETLKLSLEEYKQYCLTQNNEIAHKIDSLASKGIINSKIAELAKTNIRLFLYRQVLSYNSAREFAYRQKNNIPWNKEISLEKSTLTTSDLDFIRAIDFNNYSTLSVPEYFMFINSLLYSYDNSEKMRRIPVPEVKEQLKKLNVELTTEDYDNLSKIDSIQSLKTISRMDYQKYVGPFMKKFDKHLNKFFAIRNQNFVTDYINKTLNINSSLLNDIIKAEYSLRELDNNYKPYSPTELDSIVKNISGSFVASFIKYKNSELKNKIETNNLKKGFIVNATPKYDGNNVFNAIIEKYKGKVVYVDFWATWCSPCREGIKNIAPLKEELAGKDIVFLYITGGTSPEGAWKGAIPDIKGEHYRVTDDEWNILCQEFKIQGIPHYALVDKSGKVVNPELGHLSNEKLKKLLLDNTVSN